MAAALVAVLGLACTILQAAGPSRRMPDGKRWTTQNLNVSTVPSHCFDEAEANCRQYGRLYTWESAQQGCRALGRGWRLPADADWRRLAKQFGGVVEDSSDKGNAAFEALLTGGRSGFHAVLGGGRDLDGAYRRLNAHGFYWTASESDANNGWFYNFGRGSRLLNRHEGEKKRAFSVRCVKD